MVEKKVKGKILVNVHYYEQGNVRIQEVSRDSNDDVVLTLSQVQLETKHNISFTIPPAIVSAPIATAATKILALLAEEEGKYQVSLNETYSEMSEKTFKGLRRALPLTRQKIDWDKVSRPGDFSTRADIGAGYGLQTRS